VDQREELIEALIESLERVLDALDADLNELGGSSDPIMQNCEAAFARYRDEAERLKGTQRSDALKTRIQHAVKLQALVCSSASQAKLKIGDNLQSKGTRRQFREAYKLPPELGTSCDMAG